MLGTTVLRPVAELQRGANRRVRHGLEGVVHWAVLSAVDATLSAVEGVLTSELGNEVAQRLWRSGLPDAMGPLIVHAMESPEAERLVGQMIDSRMVDTAVERLLEADALWALIDTVAQSPAVTAAISRQGVGFADQMAGVVRQRSRRADDRLEDLVRRLGRRPPRPESAPIGDGLTGS